MKRYSSNLKDMPLLFNEMRKAASLKIDGLNDKQIIEKSVTENIFQIVKEKRKRELATKVLSRLRTLSCELLDVLGNSNIETAKVVAMYALLNTDVLFFEFFNEVYYDKFKSNEGSIYDTDIMGFLHRKAEISDVVAKWKDNNLRQLRNSYKKVLLESGFAKMGMSCMELTPPLIEKEIINLLPEEYKKAMCLK